MKDERILIASREDLADAFKSEIESVVDNIRGLNLIHPLQSMEHLHKIANDKNYALNLYLGQDAKAAELSKYVGPDKISVPEQFKRIEIMAANICQSLKGTYRGSNNSGGAVPKTSFIFIQRGEVGAFTNLIDDYCQRWYWYAETPEQKERLKLASDLKDYIENTKFGPLGSRSFLNNMVLTCTRGLYWINVNFVLTGSGRLATSQREIEEAKARGQNIRWNLDEFTEGHERVKRHFNRELASI